MNLVNKVGESPLKIVSGHGRVYGGRDDLGIPIKSQGVGFVPSRPLGPYPDEQEILTLLRQNGAKE